MLSEEDMTLAVDWAGNVDFRGWWFSEKIRDCRVLWDGCEFWTRHGNQVEAPAWFKRGLPGCRLDGGIWAGRNGFRHASTAVRFGGHWFGEAPLQFVPFDFPEFDGKWDARIREANRAVRGAACARPLRFTRIKGAEHWVDLMLKLRRLGAEGGMFRHPLATGYETGRSKNLLRIKFDEK